MLPTSNIVLQGNVRCQKKIPKTLLFFFVLSQMVGFDFGFAMALKRKHRLIIQRISIFATMFYVVMSWVGIVFLHDDLGYWLNGTEFTAYAVVLAAAKYKLYNLIYDINWICEFTTKQIKILTIVIITYAFLMYTTKGGLIIAKCVSGIEPRCSQHFAFLHYVIYIVTVINLDIIGIMQIVITYYFKCSVDIISVLLKKPQRKLDEFEKSYTAIADFYDRIKPLYNWVVSLFYFQHIHTKSSRIYY